MAYKCPLCGKSFSKKKALLGHLVGKHKLKGRKLKEVYFKAIGKEVVKTLVRRAKRAGLKVTKKGNKIIIEGQLDKDPEIEKIVLYLKSKGSSFLGRSWGLKPGRIEIDLDEDGRPEKIRVYKDPYHKRSKTTRVWGFDA